jgi:hypothetical protein
MSKKNAKTGNKEKPENTKTKSSAAPKDLLDIIDQFFEKRSKTFFYISLGLTILFSLLLFDVKVGIGGDDSTYILRAYEFIKEGVYPGYQGPLYPMLLSPLLVCLASILHFLNYFIHIYGPCYHLHL